MALMLDHLVKNDKKFPKRKKRIPGIQDSESESGESETHGKDFLGARGSAASIAIRDAMKKHPKVFRQVLEKNLLEATHKEALGPKHLLKYAGKEIPLGNQKGIGYLVTLLCLIHHALAEGDVETARFLSIAGVAMVEQSCLDSGWQTAWKLLDLEKPLFEKWQAMNVGAVQKSRTHSKLVEKRWVATIISEAKDDDYLMKKRGKGKGLGKKGDVEE